ncbi:unnamed protein product [Urochloa humidicola]
MAASAAAASNGKQHRADRALLRPQQTPTTTSAGQIQASYAEPITPPAKQDIHGMLGDADITSSIESAKISASLPHTPPSPNFIQQTTQRMVQRCIPSRTAALRWPRQATHSCCPLPLPTGRCRAGSRAWCVPSLVMPTPMATGNGGKEAELQAATCISLL